MLRQSETVNRLISARRATAREEKACRRFRCEANTDFSKSRPNPYAKQLKRQITIRLDAATVDYFKEIAAEMGIPHQNRINPFLRDCAATKPRPSIQWPSQASGRSPRRLK